MPCCHCRSVLNKQVGTGWLGDEGLSGVAESEMSCVCCLVINQNNCLDDIHVIYFVWLANIFLCKHDCSCKVIFNWLSGTQVEVFFKIILTLTAKYFPSLTMEGLL